MEATNDLAGLAVVALAALICGLVLTRLRQPAIVGYILSGVILGPSGLALVKDREQIEMLAQLGVLLLLFFIGMKLSLRAFREVWRVAVLGALIPILISVSLTLAVARVFDWPVGLAVLLGFVISLSSTVVAIKILEDIGETASVVGRGALGILIAQDLAVVPMLLVLSAMAAPAGFRAVDVLPVGGAIAFLVLLIWYLSGRQYIRMPFVHWARRDLDLVPLSGLAFCFAAAAITGAIGLSAAYGAFLAGLFVGRTNVRRRMIQSTQPIQSVLMMVFALSIGLLIDLEFIWNNLATIAVLLFIVLLVKTAMNIGVLRLLGEPWPRAFLTGTVLAQIGEFSFVLAAAGTSMGLIDNAGGRLAVTVIALSLVVSPLWLDAARRVQRLAQAGVSGGDELLRRLYGEEAEAVIARSGHAARMLAYLAHRLRPWRFRETVGAAWRPMTGVAVELPPADPAGPVIEGDYMKTAEAAGDPPPPAEEPGGAGGAGNRRKRRRKRDDAASGNDAGMPPNEKR